MDLSNYITGYSGYMYYERLLFIAERSSLLRITALSLAHNYIKKSTLDTHAYNRIFLLLAKEHVDKHSPPSNATSRESQPKPSGVVVYAPVIIPPDRILSSSAAGEAHSSNSELSEALAIVVTGNNEAKLVYDADWEESTRRKGSIRLDQLTTELKNFKANSIKESIRRGSDDLGDLYLNMGQLENARQCYSRSRDYCTSQRQEISMCLNVIKISIYQGAWHQVNAHVIRAYGLPDLRDSALPNRPKVVGRSDSGSTSISSRSTTVNGSSGGHAVSREGPNLALSIAADHLVGRKPSASSGSAAAGGGHIYRDAIAQDRSHLAIAAGLFELDCCNYRGVANNFLQVNPEHCETSTFSMITTSDLAYHITLCTLATFDRGELANQVLSSSYVRILLEAEPVCRDVLQSFYQANYAACLNRLNQLRSFLQLDYFLTNHVDALCRAIRSRALCQYFSPYSCADLNSMAQAFSTSVNALQNELATLIQDGRIKGRIDSQKQILRVLNVDQRSLTFSRALQLVEEYKKRTHSMVLRMSLTQQRLVCQASREDSDITMSYLP